MRQRRRESYRNTFKATFPPSQAASELREFISFIGKIEADIIKVKVAARGVNYTPYDVPKMLRYAGALAAVAFMTTLVWLYTNRLSYGVNFLLGVLATVGIYYSVKKRVKPTVILSAVALALMALSVLLSP